MVDYRVDVLLESFFSGLLCGVGRRGCIVFLIASTGRIGSIVVLVSLFLFLFLAFSRLLHFLLLNQFVLGLLRPLLLFFPDSFEILVGLLMMR